MKATEILNHYFQIRITGKLIVEKRWSSNEYHNISVKSYLYQTISYYLQNQVKLIY